MSRFLCLAPVYNHKQSLTEESVQCFLNQTLQTGSTLLIGDDRPVGQQLGYQTDLPGVIIYKMENRANSISAKYGLMLDHASRLGIEYDAVALWDDADLYLPTHLEEASKGLEIGSYTLPEWAWDMYQTTPQLVPTAGRFWASMTIRRSALERVGGFGDDNRTSFDQRFMGSLHEKLGPPVRPLKATYLYRWTSTQDSHTSAMAAGFDCTEWYNRTPASSATGPLQPKSQFDLAVLDLAIH